MRRTWSHARRHGDMDVTMTPMIDVVFLLLVFFVCASVGQVPDALLPTRLSAGVTKTDVELPQPELEEDEHQEVRVRLTQGNTPGSVAIQLNERPLPSVAELRKRLIRLATADPLSRIILVIDDEVSVQQFVSIYDLCQALDFQSISFAVHP